MGKYPHMLSEVIEAVHLMYEDNPDVEADCYLYLSNLNHYDSKLIKEAAIKRLDEMKRCNLCGTLLATSEYKEYHSEVDAYETFREVYCPNCDGC